MTIVIVGLLSDLYADLAAPSSLRSSTPFWSTRVFVMRLIAMKPLLYSEVAEETGDEIEGVLHPYMALRAAPQAFSYSENSPSSYSTQA